MVNDGTTKDLRSHAIHHAHNEASAIITLHNRALLRERDWDQAFWIVCDERPAERAVAALGHRSGAGADEGWEVVRLCAKLRSDRYAGKTEDAETLARAGGFIYVLGSHYGDKEGPLDPKRHFIARFNESEIERADERELRCAMDLARPAFHLHRAINDFFRDSGIDLVERTQAVLRDLVAETIDRGRRKGKRWARHLQREDHPINIEGATFLPSGRLLLGLRYPVTADGHPLLVEIDGIDRLFLDRRRRPADVEVTRAWVLANVGATNTPRGVRELDQRGSTVHVITGTIESDGKDSAVFDERRPQPAASEHHVFEVPTDDGPIVSVEARRVRHFGGESNVEGLTVCDDGAIWYVRDDQEIRLLQARA